MWYAEFKRQSVTHSLNFNCSKSRITKAVYVSLWSQHCYRLWREEFMHRMQGIRVSSRADRHTVH